VTLPIRCCGFAFGKCKVAKPPATRCSWDNALSLLPAVAGGFATLPSANANAFGKYAFAEGKAPATRCS
jgi:hypothetical protein